ncbi:DUF2868 domain-containing protein [Candidatus Nitrosacidococcus tergens]|uniref:DUF2868 domain-containing protein n=1 Tax=Candidatus Nitrosacidococcus tergens TaxID=553981 RepID=A0A7G1QA96_9GAMM|nr:DUF2868 domain-containing protein [Candidatus Nitrosacidococcus tergens]CAB1276509.1 conserved membrane protein of unknown function [Candidatus Nitrosacidococcus tergens]
MHHSVLTDLVNLKAQIDTDSSLDLGSIRQRDRNIGKKLFYLKNKPQQQLRHWLWAIQADFSKNLPGDRISKIFRLAIFILFFLGIWIGWATSSSVLAYDGTQPVNIFNVLLVFVGLQLFLLLMSTILMLPPKLLRLLPGALAFQEMLSLFSPGKLVPIAAKLLLSEQRQVLEGILGEQKINHVLYGQARKWLILQTSQIFAVGFNLGILANCLYLVITSDLAFGWSTTLNLSTESFYQIVQKLAFPWHLWIKEAVPSFDLVEVTKYYRLHKGILPNAIKLDPKDVALLGQWWQFLFMAVSAYGLLPRLGMLVFTYKQAQLALDNALIRIPGTQQILDRMNHAVIETTADTSDTEVGWLPEIIPSINRGHFSEINKEGYLINWSSIDVDEQQFKQVLHQALALDIKHIISGGGKNTIDQDQSIIEELKNTATQLAIIIVVKAWEPPLLDFLDFLEMLRADIGSERQITVIPIALNTDQKLTPADDKDLDIWGRKLQSLGDPKLVCYSLNFKVA